MHMATFHYHNLRIGSHSQCETDSLLVGHQFVSDVSLMGAKRGH